MHWLERSSVRPKTLCAEFAPGPEFMSLLDIQYQLVKIDRIQGFQFGNQKKNGRPVPGNIITSRVRNYKLISNLVDRMRFG